MKIFILSFVFLGLFSTSCTSKNKSPRAKTFVYCSEGSPSIFNPQLASDGTSFNASAQPIYNRLLDFKRGSTEIIPSLAKSWTVSQDGLTYTFKLKHNVQFHSNSSFTPTRPFNSEDVIFTFDRMMNTSNPYHKINGGNYDYFNSMGLIKVIKEIQNPSSDEVVFKLFKKDAAFLSYLAMDFMSILSKEYSESLTKTKSMSKIDFEPIGTGPFNFVKYVKDTLITYKSFDKYFEGAPKINKLIFAITPDSQIRFQKLKTGECHLIAEPSPNSIPLIEKDPNIILKKNAGYNVGYLAFNTEKAPYNNKAFRKAVNLILNKSLYIKSIYNNMAQEATNPLPPSNWAYRTQSNDLIKDQAKEDTEAKDIINSLVKEGLLNKEQEYQLWTLPVARPYNPNGKKMGELIQADLKKLGLNIKLTTFDWPTYLDKSRQGEHEMILLGWTGDHGDPDNFLHTLLSCDAVKGGSNVARWCNSKYNELVNDAKSITKQEIRKKLYIKAQKVFTEEWPWAPIAHSIVLRAYNKKVKNYILHPLGTENFSQVDLED